MQCCCRGFPHDWATPPGTIPAGPSPMTYNPILWAASIASYSSAEMVSTVPPLVPNVKFHWPQWGHSLVGSELRRSMSVSAVPEGGLGFCSRLCLPDPILPFFLLSPSSSTSCLSFPFFAQPEKPSCYPALPLGILQALRPSNLPPVPHAFQWHWSALLSLVVTSTTAFVEAMCRLLVLPTSG